MIARPRRRTISSRRDLPLHQQASSCPCCTRSGTARWRLGHPALGELLACDTHRRYIEELMATMSEAEACRLCSSPDVIAYLYKPPPARAKGGSAHTCTPQCTKLGLFCRSYRYLREATG
ncbi:hypothetical protein SMD44_p10051 (plasmid) [Streptomyces alboflavus]|uniref:Uncharacterized protein n=1 Tax=Streptomyces alboflavus TaxID=67267 RepID=A0A291W2N3_9ACTN|nr:hypothetical protein [Streptomyces alboflavus]ATM24550.1 hypothetical protein SMD44_p10051 [Streptomyces alboflavus]